MINALQKKYEDDVAACKEAITGFIRNNKPNYMPVNLGEAYKLRELDGAIVKLNRAEEKLACLKNLVVEEGIISDSTLNDGKFGMPTFEKGHSN